MQSNTRLLVRVLLDNVEYTDLGTFGAKPKICTGYTVDMWDTLTFVAIPLNTLMVQGFSFPNKSPEWYETGDIKIAGQACYMFNLKDVDVLAND